MVARTAHFGYYLLYAQAVGGDRTNHDRFQKMEVESDNLDAAFMFMLERDPTMALWLANACQDFLANRGRFADRMAWFTALEQQLKNINSERRRAAFYGGLGNVYLNHPFGVRADNLRRAVVAYEQALRFYTPNKEPLDYATTQNNLGVAYHDLSEVEERADNLRRAMAAYQQALRFYTPEADPLNYAMTQCNLGTVYSDMAQVEERADNLQRAVAAYQQALRFYTPEADPLNYALTQCNLGAAYRSLSAVEERAENLQRAVAAYQQALRFFTPEADPRDYATTQHSLGLALEDSGDLGAAVACCREAEIYYRAVGYIADADEMLDWIADGEARLNGGRAGEDDTLPES